MKAVFKKPKFIPVTNNVAAMINNSCCKVGICILKTCAVFSEIKLSVKPGSIKVKTCNNNKIIIK